MEKVGYFMNNNYNAYKVNFLKAFIFKHLIILLCLISVNPYPIPGNGLPSLKNYNIIILKVKVPGKSKIINPNYSFKPSSYFLGMSLIPIAFEDSEIELTKSVNQITLKFEGDVTSCKYMFQGCSNIIEIDLTYFESSNVQDIDYMFDGCTSLNNIKFGKFQTSKLVNMNYVFQNCISLQYLDLPSFDTSLVTHFHYLFFGCKSLKYMDLSHFDTSSLRCIHNMFNGCTSITSINLSGFNTSKATLMYYVFTNCKNLISLDLSSFEFNSNPGTYNMFDGCEKLEFVNFKIASISEISNHNYMIRNTAKNIVFCVDETKTIILNQLMESNNCSTRTYDCLNWRKYQKKIVPDLDICVDSCSSTSYPYEYLGKCYNKCPNGTVALNSMCQDCIKLGKCEDIEATEFKNKLEETITSYVDSSSVIKGNDFLAAVLSSNEINHEELFKKGLSSFELGECTDVLKQHYDINNEENLIVLNMETKKEKNESDNNSDESLNLAKNNQLEIFNKEGRQLDLSVCKEDVKFFLSLADEGKIDLDFVKSFSEQGIDVFDASNNFFNDICYLYNDNGIDIPMKDRRNYVFLKAYFCRIGCTYGGIDHTLNAAICNCNTTFIQEDENDITTNYEKNEINFKDIKNSFLSNLFSFNFDVLKCYKLVFNLKILLRNYGFYCLFFMLILQIIFVIIYLVKKLNPVKNFMMSLNKLNNKTKKKINNINIINNKSFMNKRKSKLIKYKLKLFPPKRRNNIIHLNKNENNKNSLNNLMNSKSNSYSSKRPFPSQNSQNINIYMKDNQKVIKNNLKKSLGNFDNKNDKKLNINKDEAIKLLENIYDIQNADYEEAIFYDKRGYLKMYWGFLVDTQIILGTFCTDNHLDLFAIKLSFFIFTFQISFFLNALFYTDKYISNAYHNNGVLDFVSGLPKSIYSFIATLITTNLLRMLSTSKNELLRLIIEKLKYKSYISLIQIKLAKLRTKLIIYFIIVFLFSIIFLYYVSVFCAVYRNSQKYWFLGCLESFGIDSSLSIIICIFLAIFRYISIKKHIKYLYVLGNLISNFL